MEEKDKPKIRTKGNPEKWVLVSEVESTMGELDRTEVLQLRHGCLVKVLAVQNEDIAIALTFAPNAKVEDFQ